MKQDKKWLFLAVIFIFHLLFGSTALAAKKGPAVSIHRDSYGVPHVYSNDNK